MYQKTAKCVWWTVLFAVWTSTLSWTPMMGLVLPPYSPMMLLSLVIFAYINGVYSCRGIADVLKYDVRYMWICGGKRLSFATINRFRTNHMIKCIDFYFDAVVSMLVEKGVIYR